MGWKNIKEHYRIGHIVHVGAEGICIGSGYITDIIVIDPSGKVIKRYDERGNGDLQRYQAEMDADPELLRRLVETPDQFATSIPVFTYEGSDIIEKQCETAEWPSVTHDGMLMYSNQFSTDMHKVIEWARRNASTAVVMCRRSIADTEQKLVDMKAMLAEHELALVNLDERYPMEPIPAEALPE